MDNILDDIKKKQNNFFVLKKPKAQACMYSLLGKKKSSILREISNFKFIDMNGDI